MLKALKVLSCRGNGQHRLEAKASLSISITKEKKGSSFQKHQRSAVTDGSSLPNKNKKIRVDFNAPGMFPNGGLILLGNMHGALAWKIGHLIPDFRRQEFVHHSYMEIVSQRIGQILCGYEDANDCNQLRGDSAYTYTKTREENHF